MPPRAGSVDRTDARPGKRHPLSFRVTFETRHRLEDAALVSGRSLTGELEHRLEQSFDRDDLETAIRKVMTSIAEEAA